MSAYDLLTIKAKRVIVTELQARPVESRDSVVGIATRYSLGRSLFEYPWKQEFFRTCPDRILDPNSLLRNGHRGSFPEVKLPRRGVNHQLHLAPRFRLGISAVYIYIVPTRSSCVTRRDTIHNAQVRLAEITIADARPTLNNSLHPSRVHSGQQNSGGLNSCKSRTGIDVTYSCHHNSIRWQLPTIVDS